MIAPSCGDNVSLPLTSEPDAGARLTTADCTVFVVEMTAGLVAAGAGVVELFAGAVSFGVVEEQPANASKPATVRIWIEDVRIVISHLCLIK